MISKELLLAILSMDAYNRGYGAGIAGLSDNVGTKIGSASVAAHSSSLEGSPEVNAGFYALAYDITKTVGDPLGDGVLFEGSTVIAYRGSDNPSIFASENGPSDILKGWISGVGIPSAQTALALDFYEAVTGKSYEDGRVGGGGWDATT